MADTNEKVYFDNFDIKVTESFVAIHKKMIIPLEKISEVIISHRAFLFYIMFTCATLSLLLFFFYPVILIPVFGIFAIFVRYAYDHYVTLTVKLKTGRSLKIYERSLRFRTVVYDVSDSLESALSDLKIREKEKKEMDTSTLRLRKIRNLLINSEIEMTPEVQSMLEMNTPASRKKDK